MKYDDMIFGVYSVKSDLCALFVHSHVRIEFTGKDFCYFTDDQLNDIFKNQFNLDLPRIFDSYFISNIEKISHYMRVDDYEKDCVFIGSQNVINSLEKNILIPTIAYAVYLFKDSSPTKLHLKKYITLSRLFYINELEDINCYFKRIKL